MLDSPVKAETGSCEKIRQGGLTEHFKRRSGVEGG
jgi:hypothetical protein